MKKSSSNPKHSHCHHNPIADTKWVASAKNRTTSTIVNTQNEPLQHTTKKNSLQKTSSCLKIGNSSKSYRPDLVKKQVINSRLSSNKKNAGAPTQDNLMKKNQQLVLENKALREEFCKLQESHLKDKAKIQLLISRMSQIKSENQNQSSKNQKIQERGTQCDNRQCLQKRKCLEIELHKQRIRVYQLQQEKKKWDRSREQLKGQYKELLEQIHILRDRE